MENNTRLGVFFCSCNSKITEKVNYEPITSEVKKLPQVEYLRESQNLCAHLEGELICKEITKNQLNRVVVIGCAKAREERFFKQVLDKAGLNPHLLSMVNLIEECCAVHGKSAQVASKALELTKMGIARAIYLEEVLFEKIPVNRLVLVIGGGLAGLDSALEIAGRGFKVTLIEKDDKLGGRLARVNSIIGVDRSPAELFKEKENLVTSNPNIEVKTNTKLVDLDGNIGDFTAYLQTEKLETSVKVGAIVVATGVQSIFCPVKYGLGVAENIIGQMKLERLLAEGKDFAHKKVSMVVGKVTEAFNLPFVIAVKNALLLRNIFKSTVNVFYTNIKVGGDNWEKMYTEARDAGVNFHKIENDLEITANNGEIIVNYEDPFLKGKIPGSYKISSDFIVLPEELVPADGTEELARILKLELGPASFLSIDNAHILPAITSRDGIYLAGSCQSPGFVNDIEISVKTVAEEINRKLESDQVSVELTQPYVEAAKCVVCLTCYRCCPHGAITIEHGEQFDNLYKSAAQMNPMACRRCGICAAECPGKAVHLPDYKDNQILAQLEAMEV
jgi:heterodisulfide reductase subunit A-like polyferredoxin